MPFICISIGIVLTGGLHFDGLIDTADGISAGSKRCLEAMKDSRVGAIGILILIITIFLQIAALFKLKMFYIFVLPITSFWGRYSQIVAITKYPYVQEGGSSKFHKENSSGLLIESIPSIIFIILINIILLNLSLSFTIKLGLIISTFIGILCSTIIPNLLARRLKFLSGDSYGASVVLVETSMLIIFAFLLPVI